MYACETGLRLMTAWYTQRARGGDPEWVALAQLDYVNHRSSCPVCHQAPATRAQLEERYPLEGKVVAWLGQAPKPIPVEIPATAKQEEEVNA